MGGTSGTGGATGTAVPWPPAARRAAADRLLRAVPASTVAHRAAAVPPRDWHQWLVRDGRRDRHRRVWTTGGAGGTGGAAAGGCGGTINGDLPPVYDTEDMGADCAKLALPAISGLATTVAALPDPFKLFSGSSMASRADWRCRRAEISAMLQEYELGEKPAPPSNLKLRFREACFR
jgi:hypothetical protein